MRSAPIVVAFLLGACEALTGLDAPYTLGAGAGGAGGANAAGAGGTSVGATGGGGQPGCEHATFPPPPIDTNLGGDIDFVVALRSIILGDEPETVVGFDLDEACTCDGEASSCLQPVGADPREVCDYDGGIDSNFSKLIASLSTFSSGEISSEALSASANEGRWSILLRVSDYNGQADDDHVRVAIYTTPGLPLAETAQWDGNDSWPVAPTSLERGSMNVDEPRFVDDNAYVSSGRVVASLPSSAITFGTGFSYMPLDITAGFLSGRLEPSGSSFALRDTILAGRFGIDSIFATLAEYRNGSGDALCQGDPFYDFLKVIICNLRDITTRLPGPTSPCDAVSIGIGFDAYPAQLGDVIEFTPVTDGCPPGKSPAEDSCQ